MRRLFFLAAALSVMAAPLAARADPSADVLAAAKNFSNLKYWHAEEVYEGRSIAVDYATPNRFRLQLPTGPQYVIGSDVYIGVAGHTMKMAMPQATAMIDQLRSPAAATKFAQKHTIKDLGGTKVGTVATHAYAFDDTTNGITTHNVLDIGPGALPYRLTVDSNRGKVVVLYTKFNVPVSIEPPA